MSEVKSEEKEKNFIVYSHRRGDLTIKECPAQIAQEFISYAREEWGSKQWVALKALLEDAKRLKEFTSIAANHEERLNTLEKPKESKGEEERPKTIGG